MTEQAVGTVGGYKAQIGTQTARHKKHASLGHRKIETQNSGDSLITKSNDCDHYKMDTRIRKMVFSLVTETVLVGFSPIFFLCPPTIDDSAA